MRCPRCGAILVDGGDQQFENLCEHVCNPNTTPSAKPTYVCQSCGLPGFYDDWGDYYGNFQTPKKYWSALDSGSFESRLFLEPEMKEVLESLPDDTVVECEDCGYSHPSEEEDCPVCLEAEE